MKVLVACEFSGIVRDAFTERGHDAISCDFLDTERPGKHYKGNVFDIINDGWDLMIAHPPCTYLCCRSSCFMNREGYPEKRKKAIEFFLRLYNAAIPKICIENPVGYMNTHFRKPDQIINPFNFGHTNRKKTCLWLKGLPILKHTFEVEPEKPSFIDRSGKNRYTSDMLPPSSDRWKIRSRTFQGIAKAMAEQWG